MQGGSGVKRSVFSAGGVMPRRASVQLTLQGLKVRVAVEEGLMQECPAKPGVELLPSTMMRL